MCCEKKCCEKTRYPSSAPSCLLQGIPKISRGPTGPPLIEKNDRSKILDVMMSKNVVICKIYFENIGQTKTL